MGRGLSSARCSLLPCVTQVDEGDESKDKDVTKKHPPAILTKPKEAAPPSSDFMDYAPPAVVQVLHSLLFPLQ